jgi:hypothetical protein
VGLKSGGRRALGVLLLSAAGFDHVLLAGRRFFVARPGLERDPASKLRESGECRFGFVEQPKAPRISRRRLLE